MAKVYRAPTEARPFQFKQFTLTAAIVIVVLGVLLVFYSMGKCVDHIKPTEVAVVINNITGKVSTRIEPGWIVHMPFTDVYTVDAKVQSLLMTAKQGVGDQSGVDNVKIKSDDGSNVLIDVETNYKVDLMKVDLLVQESGRGDEYKKEVARHYTRSYIRDQFGMLSIAEFTTSPTLREEKSIDTRNLLESTFSTFGININYLAATDFDYDPKFKELINQRIEMEQKEKNEVADQETQMQVQEMEIAKATRVKETTELGEKTIQNERIIKTRGEMEKLVTEALGKARAVRTDGDRLYEVAQAEANAIRAEGLNKAQGIRKLAEAYNVGGISLVREALALKFNGKTINGRPYSLDSNVSRLQLEEKAAAAQKIEKEAEKND